MLVEHNRIQRALAFKQKIEGDGRVIDVQSYPYGSIVDYFFRHNQLGSALLALKECISNHGVPPVEKDLAKLRLLCRQEDVVHSAKLEQLIGKDPIEWLRHGESHLKREMSKKGRRDIQWAQNRILA